MRRSARSALRALATATILAVASAGVLVTSSPAAHAAPLVEAATFSGTFHSTCDLPIGLEGPENGPYSCSHTATSVGCAAVVDTGPVQTLVKVCHADLTSGTTSGSADVVSPPFEAWTCRNGAGTGTFRYQPSSADPAFVFPVNLVVLGGDVSITGSYTQTGTGRTVVVRAHFPAVCAYDTNAEGYSGTVSAV